MTLRAYPSPSSSQGSGFNAGQIPGQIQHSNNGSPLSQHFSHSAKAPGSENGPSPESEVAFKTEGNLFGGGRVIRGGLGPMLLRKAQATAQEPQENHPFGKKFLEFGAKDNLK